MRPDQPGYWEVSGARLDLGLPEPLVCSTNKFTIFLEEPLDFLRPVLHNEDMTTKLSAEFGTAPVGAEILDWDWNEDEDGYKSRYEFVTVPSEAVTVISEWQVRESVTGFLASLDNDDLFTVVRFTAQRGASFVATAWQRFPQAHATLTSFLEES